MRNLHERGLHKRAGTFRLLLKKEILSFARNRLYAGLYLLFCAALCIFCKQERHLLFIVAGTLLFADLAYTSMKNDLKAGSLTFIHNLCSHCRSFIIIKISLYTILALLPYILISALKADAALFPRYPFLPLYLAGLTAASVTGAFLTRKSDSVVWAAIVVLSLALFLLLKDSTLPLQLVFSALWLLIFSVAAVLFSRRF